MGRYMYAQGGPLHGKAELIKKEHDAEEISPPKTFEEIPEGKALICVVVNVEFDAAVYVRNPIEFKEFVNNPQDSRPKTFLLIDKEKAEDLAK